MVYMLTNLYESILFIWEHQLNYTNTWRFVSMRMRSRANQSSAEESDILSNEEQQKVIEQLRVEAVSQSGFFRNIFFLIFLSVALAFLICFGYSLTQPWSLSHQQHFRDKVPHNAFLLYYALSSYCFIVAGLLVKVATKFIFNFYLLSLLIFSLNVLSIFRIPLTLHWFKSTGTVGMALVFSYY